MDLTTIRFKSEHGSIRKYKPLIESNDKTEGGYGFVFKIRDESYGKNNPTIKAVKVLKYEHTKNEKAKTDFIEEIVTLSKLNHPNITRVYDWGIVNIEGNDSLYYLMEYVEGKDLEKKIESNEVITKYFFEELVIQILTAIDTCHRSDSRIVHLDIKPDNILIENKENLRFVLTDFGKAKTLKHSTIINKKKYDTPGGGIMKYVHPELQQYLRKNKVPISVFERAHIFDLFSIGRVFYDVYLKVQEFENIPDDENPWFYFINDLCSESAEFTTCLYKFKSASEALNIAKRIHNKQDDTAHNVNLIRLSKRESIPFPKHISQYVDTFEFQRLRNISQLGTTEFVYPSAKHSRFSHSTGTYFKALNYIEQLKKQPVFNYLYSKDDVTSLLVSALLHDVGHYPYAHFIEEIPTLKNNLNINHENFSKRIMSGDLNSEYLINSKYSCEFFSSSYHQVLKNMLPQMTFLNNVIEKEIGFSNIEKINNGVGKYRVLNKIINGPIDCDKLDYITRDSACVGVSYGDIIDLERFYQALSVTIEDFTTIELLLNSKGKPAIESIVIARYQMFSEVYWHKTCRAITSMIKDAFWYAHEQIEQEEMDWAVLLLGEAEFLRWLTLKISDKQIVSDLLGGLLTNNRLIYKRFRTYSHLWNEEDDKYTTCMKLYDIHGFEEIHSYKRELIKEINSTGKKAINSWKNLQDHHIIIDIPNNKQDAAHLIKIKYPSTIDGERVYKMQDISKVSKSLYKAEDIKKIRMFCHPLYLEQIITLGNKVDKAILKCLS